MAVQHSVELERLIRGMVKFVAEISGRNMSVVEENLGSKIGTTKKGFENFYYSRAKIDERVISILLAAAAETRYLGRPWGERLLRLTGFDRYDAVVALLDSYWEADPRRPHVPHAAHNLPPPTFSQFVMRPQLYQAVLTALAAQTPLVALVGLGGTGKSSLAREIVGQCLQVVHADPPRLPVTFDAIIWVSDKDQPGTTRLSSVLETIAVTLGYPEWSRFEALRLQRAVDQLLRGQRILVVIDNFETINDPALNQWLLSIPSPSKALITSRVYPAAFQDKGTYRVDVPSLAEREAQEFIATRSAQLGLTFTLDPAAQALLIARTGSNPMAIHIALGLLRTTGRSLADVFSGVSAQPQAMLEGLIASSWAVLTQDEAHALLALTLFPAGADDQALATVAGLDAARYEQAIQRLDDQALIVRVGLPIRGVEEPLFRSTLHPLVRHYAEARFADDPQFAAAARSQRLGWAIWYANTYGGHQPNNPTALTRIEREEPTLWATLLWAANHGYDRDATLLARKLEYYYYTRALWGKKLELHSHYILAAKRLQDVAEQINALALHVQLCSRQGQPEQAQNELADLYALTSKQQLTGASFFSALHAVALAAQARGDLQGASEAWEMILAQHEKRGVSAQLVVGTQHWLALCRYRQGEISVARTLMQESLDGAQAQGNTRRVARNLIALAQFDLDEGQVETARTRLAEVESTLNEADSEQRAHYHYAHGRLCLAKVQGNLARQALTQALEGFERMGLANESNEVREALAGLDKY